MKEIQKIIKRLIANTAHKLLVVYWFLVRPKTRGAKCLIEHNGKFLLVRPGYSHMRWTIPGGGVNKRETFEEAARREAMEEVGVQVGDLKMFWRYFNKIEFKDDTVEVFYAKVEKPEFKIDNFEIIEAGWFSRENLPEGRMPRVDKIFAMLDLFVANT